MRYRTEIDIPPDGYVCVQLPSFVPAGRAILTIIVTKADSLEPTYFLPTTGATDPEIDTEFDRQDIEWWDEFEGDAPRDH